MKLKPRERYRIGPWHIQTGLRGGWWHDDYDGAPDAGDDRAGWGIARVRGPSWPMSTFHECLAEIAEWEENQ